MIEIPEYYFRSMPETGCLITAEGLKAKVDAEGRLKPFAGETVVFLPDDDTKTRLMELQERCFSSAGGMLAQDKLSRDSMHMTLHDLWNEADGRACPTYSHVDIARCIESVRRNFPRPVSMRAVSIMSMVATSLVLALVPADEKSRLALQGMHSRFDALWPLPYGLTPHITLAYYRPGVYEESRWRRLSEAFALDGFCFELSAEKLVFQHFDNMNKYRTI